MALYYIAAMKADDNLIEYLQSSHEEAKERGLALFADRKDEIVIAKKIKKQYFFQIPSETTKKSYAIRLSILVNDIDDYCECKAFKRFGQCKHCVAAGLFLLVNEHDYEPDILEGLIEEDEYSEFFEDDDDEEMFEHYNGDQHVFEKASTDIEKASNIKPLQQNFQNDAWKTFEHDGLMDAYKISHLSADYWPNQVILLRLRLQV